MSSTWDLLIKGAKLFDGSGDLPVEHDLAIKDGKVVGQVSSSNILWALMEHSRGRSGS